MSEPQGEALVFIRFLSSYLKMIGFHGDNVLAYKNLREISSGGLAVFPWQVCKADPFIGNACIAVLYLVMPVLDQAAIKMARSMSRAEISASFWNSPYCLTISLEFHVLSM